MQESSIRIPFREPIIAKLTIHGISLHSMESGHVRPVNIDELQSVLVGSLPGVIYARTGIEAKISIHDIRQGSVIATLVITIVAIERTAQAINTLYDCAEHIAPIIREWFMRWAHEDLDVNNPMVDVDILYPDGRLVPVVPPEAATPARQPRSLFPSINPFVVFLSILCLIELAVIVALVFKAVQQTYFS